MVMGLLMESCVPEIFILLTMVAYWYFTSTFDYWEKRNVPFMRPIPLFGSAKDLFLCSKSVSEYVQQIYQENEGKKIVGLWIMRKPVLFVRDPEVIKRIFVKDFNSFHDRGLVPNEKCSPLHSHLISLSGKEWQKLRVKLSPTFSSGKIKSMQPLMNECAKEMVEFLKDIAEKEEPVDINDISARYTTDIIGTCAFGLRCNSFKETEPVFLKMSQKILKPSTWVQVRQVLLTAIPVLRDILHLQFPEEEVEQFFLNVVKDTVNYRQKYNIKRNDYLDLLIQVRNEDLLLKRNKKKSATTAEEESSCTDFELTDTRLAAQAFVFFLAGFDTITATTSFTLYELALNKGIQNKLRKEINALLEANNGELSYKTIMDMEYLHKVICETLRKYPPVSVTGRICTTDYVIPDIDCVIEKGMRVYIPIYGLHHDPNYFPNPSCFDPEHFSEESKAKRANNVYIPFGDGPRICIGSRFGLLQVKTAVAQLVANYEFSPCERTQTPLKFVPGTFTTQCKGGIWLRITRRLRE